MDWTKIVGAIVGILIVLGSAIKVFYSLPRQWAEDINMKLETYHKEQEEIRKERGKFYDKEFKSLEGGMTTIILKLEDIQESHIRHDEKIKNIEEDVKDIKRKTFNGGH